MLNQTAAVARLSREMLASESSIADALVNTTALMHSFALACRDNDAAPTAVHANFQRIQKMTGTLVDARAEAFRVHGSLRQLQAETCGPAEPTECPEDWFVQGENDVDKIAA